MTSPRRRTARSSAGQQRLLEHGPAELTRLVLAPTLDDVLRRWLAGTITDERFEQAIEDLADLPLARFPTRGLMRRAFELRANVTAYDACYVALAEALDSPLCTVDHRLAHTSGPRCTMQLITHAD